MITRFNIKLVLLLPVYKMNSNNTERHIRLFTLLIGIVIGLLLSFIFTCNYDCPPRARVEFGDVTEVAMGNVMKESMAVHEQLAKDIRILCWVITCPKNHETKAIHVAKTWGKRCTKLLFMSTENDVGLGAVKLPVREGRKFLWGKTKASLQYIYENHLDDADWFIKADDDTYVIMENLRYLVYPYSPQRPIFFGLKFKEPDFHVDMFATGGPGYVLSKEAVRRFVVDALPNGQKCNQSDMGIGEDVEISKCLLSVGVELGESRDALGRQRFFHLDPQINLMDASFTAKHWYWKYRLDPRIQGQDCCSDLPVSFHHIKPGQMYDLDYLIYKVRPYGFEHQVQSLPEKINWSNTSDQASKIDS